jgi:PAS domain S-box-containing protein
MYSCPNVLHYLTLVAPVIPFPIYWTSAEPRVLGANQACLEAMGAKQANDVIGQTPFDYYPEELAKSIVDHIHLVIKTGETLTQEDVIQDITTGKTRYYAAIRSPLVGEDGKIVGVIGTSIEITAEKEAERLNIENNLQRVALDEKEKFTQLARKVAHDINSPLSALIMMIPLCDGLPEEQRISLTRAAESIYDISNNLLNSTRKQKNPTTSEIEPRQPLLVSDLLIQLLSQKKVEYRNQPVTFNTIINHGVEFAFIQCQTTEFRRAMSNLINNAVDALENKADGIVTIQLTVNADTVVVEVTDNGFGMPSLMIERIRRRESFTSGKVNGSGLGLQQIWDTLEYNEGTMKVQSKLRQGTSIKLSFARITAPSWIAQDIHLTPHSIILILDDDESIHAAWNLRFSSLSTSNPTLHLHHFIQGQEVLNFLASLNQEERNHVVFLSDYELLHQNRNGLQIIEASEIKGAMLVTSYYSNQKIREEADRLGIKVLPKQMASVIPIYVD